MIKYDQKDIERFWGYVDKKSEDECWEWKAFKDRKNYGRLGVGKKIVRAHRFSFLITYKKEIDGLIVMHKCDNPPCCNPRHLDLGTHIDNVRDRDNKGRQRSLCGSESHYAKLDENKVMNIREECRSDTVKNIASKYGVCIDTIYNIRKEKSWKHLLELPNDYCS